MIRPVTQLHTQGSTRRDGHTDEGIPGDCWRTALAALLDRDPVTVPHFALYRSWWDETRRWLQVQGRDLAYAELDDHLHEVWLSERPDVPVLLGGPSPRGPFRHVVVGYPDGRLAWDPHPTRAGLAHVDEFFGLVEPYPHLPARLALEAAR